jgi:hypothetical protein
MIDTTQFTKLYLLLGYSKIKVQNLHKYAFIFIFGV